MQTSSYDDLLTRPLRTGICPTPDLWPSIPWREVGLPERVRPTARKIRREIVDSEKMRILMMLEDKKINAEEAARLIEALDKVDARPSERELKRRWVHIKVERDGEQTVNVKLPLALLKLGLKLAPKGMGVNIARIERAKEQSLRRAEKAQERARKVQEKIRRRLEEKLGPDADLSELNGAFDEAFEGLRESGIPEPPEPPAGLGGQEFLRDLDLDKILAMAQEDGFDGKLVDIHDDENDEHVTISLE